MNQLQKIFNYQGRQVRTVIKDGDPWFVASDVCNVLDIKNATQAVSKLKENQRSMFNIGRQGQANVVNESGLYKLIFKSRKEEAETFQDWIAEEVLPSIRKTGSFKMDKPKSAAEMLLNQAELMVEYEKRINNLESQTAAAHHRIDNFDKIDTIGDLQQRLNKMIKLYAANSGITFQQAWRNFKGAFNTAYRTNITMLIENYKLKHGFKNLSTPEWLSKVNRLDDGIRVADKLLNQSIRGDRHVSNNF